jgi:hypothetical protein
MLIRKTFDRIIQVILSYGMGVESTAILLRWIFEPETCPCDLSDLLVITAQVGDEFRDTGDLVTTHILPLLRASGVRYIQVARSGHLGEDGIAVLSDTRSPEKVFLDGVYKLSDEMTACGTVPQYAGVHRCAVKMKAWVIEQWFAHYYNPSVVMGDGTAATVLVKHAIGYNAEEITRIAKSEYAVAKRDAEAAGTSFTMRVAFGFNAEETSRIENAGEYDGLRGRPIPCGAAFIEGDSIPGELSNLQGGRSFKREAFYPLLEWGWTRQDCLDYIKAKIGVGWLKSCCAFCPFACNKQNFPELIRRHKMHTDQVADALVMEHLSLAMNPRGTLYRDNALIQITLDSGNTVAIAEYELKLAVTDWALYRVRRIYEMGKDKRRRLNPAKKGQVKRAVEKLEVFPDKDRALKALRGLAEDEGLQTTEVRGIPYTYRQRCEKTFPTREEYFTVAPALVETKARYGISRFDGIWNEQQQSLFHEELAS